MLQISTSKSKYSSMHDFIYKNKFIKMFRLWDIMLRIHFKNWTPSTEHVSEKNMVRLYNILYRSFTVKLN